ncbi:MAG: hypothetical protein KFF73_02950 [Cyclobacteriaceae bacterium]|nr:hypothetical protein [Cyclobacteriaceae bacterium]
MIFLKGWKRDFHHSADLIAVYVAIRGHEPYFQLRQKGYFHIFEDGTHVWRHSPDKVNHFIIGEFVPEIDPEKVAEDFDKLLIKK